MSATIIKISYEVCIDHRTSEEFDQKLYDFMEEILEIPESYVEDSLQIDIKNAPKEGGNDES